MIQVCRIECTLVRKVSLFVVLFTAFAGAVTAHGVGSPPLFLHAFFAQLPVLAGRQELEVVKPPLTTLTLLPPLSCAQGFDILAAPIEWKEGPNSLPFGAQVQLLHGPVPAWFPDLKVDEAPFI